MMKKLLLIAVLGLFSFNAAHAQTGLTGIRVGVNAGIPVGDVDDYASFKAGADLAYMISLMDIVQVGPMVGYSHYFGKDGFDDLQYLPIAASGRLGLPSSFVGGFDLGYAVGLTDGLDGGLYWRPLIGFRFMNFGVMVSYEGITEDAVDVSSLNVGVEFKF
jgi:hypothetical protein